MAVAWIQNFPGAGWQSSANSGGSWSAYPTPVNQGQVGSATGVQRYRPPTPFTVPAGLTPTHLRVRWRGDLHDTAANVPPELRIDGVAVAVAPFPLGVATTYESLVPVPAAGAHTFEVWVGSAGGAGGITRLDSVTFDLVTPLPCNCCPTGAAGCALVAVRFDSVAETVPQAGWNQVDLPATIDGVTATAALSGYTTTVGNTPSAALRITYGLSSPHNRVRGVRLWNQGGGDLTDSDGLNHFTAEFYAGVTLLSTVTWQVGNLAAPFTRLLPSGLELNGVTSVVLRTLDKQIGGAQAPFWREFQLLEFQPVLPCRQGTTVTWYDLDGNVIPNADVVSCETPPQPILVSDLNMLGQFFGDGPDPQGENLCDVLPTPSATTNLTLGAVSPNCYDPNGVGNPTMTWGPTTSVEMSYGNLPHTTGGAIVQFSATSLGGSITWPTSAFQMAVGETLTSNLLPGGRRAVLTYVSGPAQSSPSGTIQPTGGASLFLHRFTTDNTTQPIRFRIDFIQQ